MERTKKEKNWRKLEKRETLMDIQKREKGQRTNISDEDNESKNSHDTHTGGEEKKRKHEHAK